MISNANIIPLAIVGIFLLVTLVIGLYAGRGIKNIKDYALGGKNFSTATLVLTLLATYIGAASIGAVDKIYSSGIIITIASFGLIFQHLFFAFVITPKITEFNQCLTIGDLMGQLYGMKAKVLTGVIGSFFTMFDIGIQFYMIGKVCSFLLGIDTIYGIIIGGSILSFYSAIGGIKAVTLTDVFQFLILIIVIPIIAALLLNEVGGYKELFLKVSKEKFLIFKNENFYYYLNFFLVYALIPRNIIFNAVMQRAFMVKNKKQLKSKFLIAAAFDPIFRITLMVIGLCAIVLYPNLKSKDIFIQVIDNLFNNNIMKGIAISGVLSILMSTADSLIHSAGLVTYNDIYKPFFIKKTQNKDISIIKIATIIIGALSIFIAIKISYGLNILNVLIFSYKFPVSILLSPLFIGIMGIKTDKKSFITGITTALIYIIVSSYFFSPLLNSMATPIAMLVNAIAFLTMHLIQNKGFVFIKRNNNDKFEKKKMFIPKLKDILSYLYDKIPTPKKIFLASKKSVMQHGANNLIFGIFCCINFILPYMIWKHETKQVFDIITCLRLTGGLMAGLLIVKSEWNKKLKLFFPLFWHFTLLYCLPFLTTVMFLITKGSLPWLINVTISLFFLILLVDETVFIILASLGIILGLAFYKFFIGNIDFNQMGFSVNFLLAYQLFSGTIIALLFACRKKLFYMIKSNQGINLGLSMGHELKNTGLNILPYSQISKMYFKKSKKTELDKEKGYFLNEKCYKILEENNNCMYDLSQQMLRIVKSFEQLMLEYKSSLANPQLCSLRELIEETINQYHFDLTQREQVNLELSQDFRVKVPRKIFIFVINNIIRNAFKHGKPNKIDIWIDNDELHIRDDGKGIPSSRMPNIFKIFYTTGNKTSSGIGLAFAKQVIETANGEIWCNSQIGEGSYTEFTIKFPAILMDVTEEEQKEALVTDAEKKISILIAKKMLNRGIDKEMTANVTGLSKKEIDKI